MMAYPITIPTAINGLLDTASQVSSIIFDFISRHVADAPESARRALSVSDEVVVLLTTLKRQVDCDFSSVPLSRKQMIRLTDLVVVIGSMIPSCSRLEAIVKTTIGRGRRSLGTVWWALKEANILGVVETLERQKLALSLMVGILQSESDSTRASDDLRTLQRMMDSASSENQDLIRRLERFEVQMMREDDVSTICGKSSSSASYVTSTIRSSSASSYLVAYRPFQSATSGFIQETTLEETRVYRRVQFNKEFDRLDYYHKTSAWKMLAGLRLNDISSAAVIALPITLDEINSISLDLTFAKTFGGKTDGYGDLALSYDDLFALGLSSPDSGTSSLFGTFSTALEQRYSAYPRPPKPSLAQIDPKQIDITPFYRLALVGDEGVGQSKLAVEFFYRFCLPPWSGASHRGKFLIDGSITELEIRDANREESDTSLTTRFRINNCHGVFIVYSVRNRRSFDNVLKYYVENLRYNIPIMFVGINDTSDSILKQQVTTAEGLELAMERGCEFAEVSFEPQDVSIQVAFFDMVRSIRRRDRENALEQEENLKTEHQEKDVEKTQEGTFRSKLEEQRRKVKRESRRLSAILMNRES